MTIRKTLAVVGLLVTMCSTGALASNTRSVKDGKGPKSEGSTGNNGLVVKESKINGVNGYTGLFQSRD